MTDIVVIYHQADFDGLFCCEIARKFFGPRAEYIGWDYGDPLPSRKWFNTESDGSPTTKLYMLDISVEGLMDYPGLVWIDHHKTAIDNHPGVKGYQIDGVAACRLAWQYFSTTSRDPKTFALPDKQAFIDRRVSEPPAVRLAGEYDVFDRRDPEAFLFQHGLRSEPLTPVVWGELLNLNSVGQEVVRRLLKQGTFVEHARGESDKLACANGAFELSWEGLRWLAINSGGNSLLFASAEELHHDGLLMFRWTKDKWRISLYHTSTNKENDLSAIAKRHGGGGHRGACGFECHTLPFQLP